MLESIKKYKRPCGDIVMMQHKHICIINWDLLSTKIYYSVLKTIQSEFVLF